MAVVFVDVARALDEVIEMEEGVRAERLCVALARRKYPGLIATESKKDSGQDAIFVGNPLEGVGVPGIAVSITNTLSKVKADAKAIKDSGKKIDSLIFYTPKKVSNTKAQDWAKDIESEFGHKLLVIPREELIHSLLEPENAFILKRYLGIEVDRSQDLNRIVSDATTAARLVAEQWMAELQVAHDQLITLSAYELDGNGDRLGEVDTIEDLKLRLVEAERLLLFGGPGAGKSTTLTMIATSVLGDSNESVPLLVSIPEFLDTSGAILDYVADQPSFRSQGVSGSDLVLLAERGHIVLLLNGLNEVSGVDLVRASRELKKLVREYPSAGVLFTSRPLKADLFGGVSVSFDLSEVSDTQRDTYLRARLPEKSEQLLSLIEDSSSLDSLSRSPFILEQLVALYEADGTLPNTRSEVLESIIVKAEQLPEHAPALAAEPIKGYSQDYLAALATEMTSRGRVSLFQADACRVISALSASLVTSGLRASSPEPLDVLKGLCAHHLLEEISYPEGAFRFSHQQFQESFGATALRARATSVLEDSDATKIILFQSEIIDLPVWEESLSLLAERLGAQGDEEAATIVSALVEWAVQVDLVFAARLCGISGPVAENMLIDVLEPVLRRWYCESSSAHRACAIAAMVATGSGRFTDILWGLLEDENRDIRVTAFDAAGPIELSVLGDGWKNRVDAWPSDRRIEFIDTVGHSGSQDGVDLACDFAVNDPDIKVRLRALNVFWFEGSRAKFMGALEAIDDDTFRSTVARGHLPEKLPSAMEKRQTEAIASLISKSDDAKYRIKLASKSLPAGDTTYLEQLKTDLGHLEISESDYQYEWELYEIIKNIRSLDEPWAVQWVQSRILGKELRLAEWIPLSRLADSSTFDPLLDELASLESSEPRFGRSNELLAAAIDAGQIDRLLSSFMSAHFELEDAPNLKPESLKNSYFRIRDLLRALPIERLAETVSLRLVEADDEREIWELLDLLGVGQVSEFEDDSARQEMDPYTLERLRQFLRDLVPVVESADDFDGRLISRLGSAIGRFGDKQDIPLIQQLIKQDIERVNIGYQVLLGGNQQDPRASGSRMRWDSWLIGALLNLSDNDCEDFLLGILHEPVYEDEAARGLLCLVRIPQERSSPFRNDVQSYVVAAGLRQAPRKRFLDEEKRNLYADAVKQLLLDTVDRGGSNTSTGRLKQLASNLSLFNREEDVQLILDQLLLDGKWDAWVVLDTIERLVFAGITVKAEAVKKALDPVVKKIVYGDEWYQSDQQVFLLGRAVKILLSSDDPSKATELLSSLYPSILRLHDLYDIVEIAGLCQSEAVVSWLMSLLENTSLEDRLSGQILSSLVKIGGRPVEDGFLAILGLSDAAPIPVKMCRETIETYALAMAEKVARDPTVKQSLIEKCNEDVDSRQLTILSSVINMAKDPDLDLAALQLIRDGQKIPWEIQKIVKRAFYEEVPIPGSQGAYNVNPIPDVTFRTQLIELVYRDELRRESAYELLGEIESWRLESGKPDSEPRHPSFSSGYSWPIIEGQSGGIK